MINSRHQWSSDPRLKSAAALLVILAAGVGLRILHWSPSADGDEARYINHAVALAHGNRPEYFDGAVAVRIPYLAMLAAWGKVFGYTTVALQASGIVTYVLGTCVLWILTARLYDRSTAAVAALLFTLLPLQIRLATHALTDDLALCAALAALALMGRARERAEFAQAYAGTMLLSGLLTGLAVGIRQPYVFVPIIGLIWLSLEKAPMQFLTKAAIPYLIGVMVYAAAEMFAFRLWTGDWLFRFRQDVVGVLASSAQLSAGKPHLLANLFAFRGYFPALLPSGPFSLLPLLGAIAAVDRLSRRDRRAIWPLLGCTIFVLYFGWGSTSFTAWRPPAVNSRYLLPVMALLCVLVAAFLVDLNRAYRFAPFTIVVGAAVFTGISVWSVAYNSRPNCVTDMVKAIATVPGTKGMRLGYPESIKRCFLPIEFWPLLDSFQLIRDEELAKIETVDLSEIDGLIVPNETFYRYAHIGVVDALERTKDWWTVEPVIGPKWPRYLTITGKPSDRVVGYIYWLKSAKGGVDGAESPSREK